MQKLRIDRAEQYRFAKMLQSHGKTITTITPKRGQAIVRNISIRGHETLNSIVRQILATK
jgi:hypothetical protein